jgi:hypothetical protein
MQTTEKEERRKEAAKQKLKIKNFTFLKSRNNHLSK